MCASLRKTSIIGGTKSEILDFLRENLSGAKMEARRASRVPDGTHDARDGTSCDRRRDRRCRSPVEGEARGIEGIMA